LVGPPLSKSACHICCRRSSSCCRLYPAKVSARAAANPCGVSVQTWVVDSDGFRRSFAQLPYGTNLHLKLHGKDGEKGRPRRVRVSRDEKTVGYLSSSMSQRYLPVVKVAESLDAELTVSGVVAEYRYETSLTVFLPTPEAMENVIRRAVAAAGE
jgi:hypothetical protein